MSSASILRAASSSRSTILSSHGMPAISADDRLDDIIDARNSLICLASHSHGLARSLQCNAQALRGMR